MTYKSKGRAALESPGGIKLAYSVCGKKGGGVNFFALGTPSPGALLRSRPWVGVYPGYMYMGLALILGARNLYPVAIIGHRACFGMLCPTLLLTLL